MPDRLAWDWLGSIADVTSLVMLPITAYAAWKVRSISAKVAFNVRAPRTLDRIDALAETIRLALETGEPNLDQVMHLITQCKAEIETIQTGATGPAALAAKHLALVFRRIETDRDEGKDVTSSLWSALSQIATFKIHARSLHDERQIGASNDS